jgi:hypothetical protein
MMMDQNEGDKKGVVWLNAWRDPVANLKAYSSRILNLLLKITTLSSKSFHDLITKSH